MPQNWWELDPKVQPSPAASPRPLPGLGGFISDGQAPTSLILAGAPMRGSTSYIPPSDPGSPYSQNPDQFRLRSRADYELSKAPRRGSASGAPQTPAPPNWRQGGRWSPQEVERRARNALRLYELQRQRGMAPDLAAGWAANGAGESDSDFRLRQNPGPGVGLYQWGANNPRLDRRRDFQRVFGHPIEQSTEDEQLAFRDWELAHTERRAARMIAHASTPGDIAAAITRYYERPAAPARDAADRANIAEAIHRLDQARPR